MKIVCAWCRSVIGFKQPMTDHAVTHGICPGCLARTLSKLKETPCTDAESVEPAPNPSKDSSDT